MEEGNANIWIKLSAWEGGRDCSEKGEREKAEGLLHPLSLLCMKANPPRSTEFGFDKTLVQVARFSLFLRRNIYTHCEIDGKSLATCGRPRPIPARFSP